MAACISNSSKTTKIEEDFKDEFFSLTSKLSSAAVESGGADTEKRNQLFHALVNFAEALERAETGWTVPNAQAIANSVVKEIDESPSAFWNIVSKTLREGMNSFRAILPIVIR
jgi:hypothetical protein